MHLIFLSIAAYASNRPDGFELLPLEGEDFDPSDCIDEGDLQHELALKGEDVFEKLAIEDNSYNRLPVEDELVGALENLKTLGCESRRDIPRTEACEKAEAEVERLGAAVASVNVDSLGVKLHDQVFNSFQLIALVDPIGFATRKFQDWASSHESASAAQIRFAIEVTIFFLFCVHRALGDPTAMLALETVIGIVIVSKSSTYMIEGAGILWSMITPASKQKIESLLPTKAMRRMQEAFAPVSAATQQVRDGVNHVSINIHHFKDATCKLAARTLNHASAAAVKAHAVSGPTKSWTSGLSAMAKSAASSMATVKNLSKAAAEKVNNAAMTKFVKMLAYHSKEKLKDAFTELLNQLKPLLSDKLQSMIKYKVNAVANGIEQQWISFSYEFVRAMYTEPISSLIMSQLFLEFSIGRAAVAFLMKCGGSLFK